MKSHHVSETTEFVMPSIRMLKTFWAVAKGGSFAAAAETVSLTQAAVSLQMRSLEETLNRPLFDRSARQIMLSRHGRELLPKVEQILTLLDELSADPQDVMQGPVTIGAVVSVIGALSFAVAQLKTLHPLLDVRLLSARSDELAAMVERGDVDIAAIVGREGETLPPHLHWTTLYTEPFVLVTHPDVAPDTPKAILAVHRFLRFDRHVRTGVLVDQVLRTLAFPVNEYLELNSIDTIVSLVRKNVGVAVLPLLHGGDWKHDLRLQLLPLPTARLLRTVGVIQRTAFARRGITAAIVDLLESAFEVPGTAANHPTCISIERTS
jgi:DNA-binding transcriptional LysR family regulator